MKNYQLNLNWILRICGKGTSSFLQWQVEYEEESFHPERYIYIGSRIKIVCCFHVLWVICLPTHLYGSYDGHVLGNLVIVFYHVRYDASAAATYRHSPLELENGCGRRGGRGGGARGRYSSDEAAAHRPEDRRHRHSLLHTHTVHTYIYTH